MAGIFADEYVPNAEGVPYHKQWVKQNPGESAKWIAYRDAVKAHKKGTPDPVPPSMATKYGKALVAAGKLQVSVTDIGGVWTPPPTPPSVLTGTHWAETNEYANLKSIGYSFNVTTFQPGNDNTADPLSARSKLDAASAAGIQLIIGMYPEPYTWTGSTWTISANGIQSLNYLKTRESLVLALFVFNEPYWVSGYSANQLRILRNVIRGVWPTAKIYHDMGQCKFWADTNPAVYGDQSGTLDYSGSWYYPFKDASVGLYPQWKAYGLSILAAEETFITNNIGGGAKMVWLGQSHTAPSDNLLYPSDAQISDWNQAIRGVISPTNLISWYVWRQGIYPDYLVNHPTQWPLTV